MPTTERAHPWLRSPGSDEDDESDDHDTPRRVDAVANACDELATMHARIESLMRTDDDSAASADAISAALESSTRVQIARENLDACRPPSDRFAGPALVALADRRLYGHADAIERGITYTADNQMRLLKQP